MGDGVLGTLTTHILTVMNVLAEKSSEEEVLFFNMSR